MARLTAPNGSTVNVSDEKAQVLLQQGYKAADKSTSKSTSSSSKSTGSTSSSKSSSK